MKHWEKPLSKTTVYKGRVVRLNVDKVQLENGRTSQREVIHHPGGACVVALDEQERVYLVRQFRYPFGEELWELPAGKLEPGENPLLAAQRELGEECGLSAQRYFDLGPIYPTVGYCDEVIYTWLATGLSPCQLEPDEDEFLTVEAIEFEKAVSLVLSGKIRDSKTVAGLLKVYALKQKGQLSKMLGRPGK